MSLKASTLRHGDSICGPVCVHTTNSNRRCLCVLRVLDDRGGAVGLRILSSPRRLDRLWGPPNLLSNGHWGALPPPPEGKAAGA
jgi:hypothetical protein